MHRALIPRRFLLPSSTRYCSTNSSAPPPSTSTSLAADNEARARSYLEKYSSHRDKHLTPSSPTPPLSLLKKRIPPTKGPLPHPTNIQHVLEHSHGALDIQIIDVRAKAPFADFLVICTGRSERHVAAIAEGIKLDMRRSGVLVDGDVVGICGTGAADWKAVDIGPVVVHVMTEDARRLYDLEGLWMSERVPMEVQRDLVN